MRTWHRMKLGACILTAMAILPTTQAISNSTPAPDGPSQEETLTFITDTWGACATMRSGWQRMIAKDGSVWEGERMAKVDAVALPPSSLRIITRLNERRKLTGLFEIQAPEEKIQEFDLTALSSDVGVERDGQESNLFGIRLRCARAACVTEWVASLAMPGKSMHDLKTGKLLVTRLDDLVYEHHAPKDNPSEQNGEAYIPVCDKVALESLSKAFQHAIHKAGGKKPLF
ncbi:MAG: hypothetical protein AB7P24_19050 [Nitrospira sp.]